MGNAPYVIAEAGTCHADPIQGMRLAKALRYVQRARDAGASAVKFQMFSDPIRDDMFCWIEGDEERSIRWLESDMPLDDWMRVKGYADSLGIDLLASVFQHRTVEWIEKLGLRATKVASRATATFPYGSGPTPYLVSNGMAPIPDRDDVIGLQCEANYPSSTPWAGELPGFSDHSGKPDFALDALERGCRLVEVHFYDDPNEAGPDLPASLSVDELALVCAGGT